MPRALGWMLATGVLYGSVMGCVFADQEVPVEAAKMPAAPIEVLRVDGRLLEYRSVPSRVGAARHTRTKSANIRSARFTHWDAQIRYRNDTKQRISAVRFQWKLLDAFDQTCWVVEVTDGEGLTPGESRQRQWEQQISQAEDVVKALLIVKMVRFQDGTFWPPTSQEIEAPEPDDVIRMERKRLRSLYDDRGLEALLRALRD